MTDTPVPARRPQRRGRPEQAISASSSSALFRTATLLRELRTDASLTYGRLEKITGFSATQLKRAGRGERTSVDVVIAYAQGCGASSDIVRVLSLFYAHADEAADTTVKPKPVPTTEPKPEHVSTSAQFTHALHLAWQRAYQPSLRTIEANSWGLIPKTTAARILKGESIPDSPRRLHAFLVALGIPDVGYLVAWFGAWIRVLHPDVSREHEELLADGLAGDAALAFHLAADRERAENEDTALRARLATIPCQYHPQILDELDRKVEALLAQTRAAAVQTLRRYTGTPPARLPKAA
ncbi:helix-turn-helix domain-containing protein [Streptomyces sp. NPDC059070]|uniref:helix-turn-helix domain-containing protein n=1 Tax=Streptomyces sp. NPDC059070 TaxID=3346713 RepID=UPI003691FA81